jgi:phosphonate transport system ATP-binding protein
MNTPDQPLIALDQVGVTFPGGVRALAPTSLSFHRGGFTVLLGCSGAGKSTLLRTLNLLQLPTTGAIVAEGLPAAASRADIIRHRRRTGMIFQQHQLIPNRSVLRNVLTGRLGHHGFWGSLALPAADRRLALACLDRVGLLHKALQRADQLSGGEQQRVGIARALAQEPRLLLADEPVASLDPARSFQLLTLLREICRESGIATVVSLHQVGLARRFADRVIGLRAGEVVFDGPPRALTQAALLSIYGDRDALEQAEAEESSLPANPATDLSLSVA